MHLHVDFERVAPVLPVRNVARALELYRKLGFEADSYQEPGTSADDPIYGFLSWGPVEIHISRFRELDPAANTSACYLYVGNADALHAMWSAAGVEGRLLPLSDTPYGLREFAFVDPDGNLLRVGSPRKKGR
jgi:catechol 2,3-dioxygenase-like lactoylglutathione lyase family enzyme